VDAQRPSIDDFKKNIETLFGQSLTARASEAAEDFWNHWFSFSELIAQRSLTVNVDALQLSQIFPQYNRYHVWKGIGIIAVVLGIILALFFWKFGLVFIVAGIGLRFWGQRLKFNDAKEFAEELMKEATLNPQERGYARLCGNYIAGTIRLVSPSGSAIWPQFPSNAVTGEQSLIQIKSA